MKQQEKTLLKQKSNNKQIEIEKEVKPQQEIVQPKIFNLSRRSCLGIKLIFYYVA